MRRVRIALSLAVPFLLGAVFVVVVDLGIIGPGLPKDIICYIFGISPMPLWLFTVVSSLGRIPGTWWLSASGAHTATGDYRLVILVSAVFAAIALPLYYYRHRLVAWLQGRTARAGTHPTHRA